MTRLALALQWSPNKIAIVTGFSSTSAREVQRNLFAVNTIVYIHTYNVRIYMPDFGQTRKVCKFQRYIVQRARENKLYCYSEINRFNL